MDLELEKKNPVLVTGATGYVAGWLIKKLLDQGFTVHAAVRDPTNKSKVEHLDKLAESSAGTIKYFKSDLLDEGSYEDAMKNCSVVFHTASPFIFEVKDPQKDLVDPAKKGTRNVLETVNKCDSVKRVVLTSSVAAMYGDNADLQDAPNNTLTEECWNTTSSLTRSPYSYSKTEAEKEAWKIFEEQSRWELVVVNPSLVIGPGINPFATSESFKIVREIGDGTLKSGLPYLGLAVVDVRDTAEGHFKAGFLKDVKGRYIISGENTSLTGIAAALLPKYEAYPIPRWTIPKPLVWLIGPWVDSTMTRSYVSRNVNYPLIADNSKGVKELGLKYRPLKDSIQEMFQQLIDSGQIPSVSAT
ncbi:related to aldehyde reductase II [Zygosaccharomyces bailii ISA1307]|nr:related to aldehyde reductase II [Zygosaccharomyces bailii ISA1307]